MKHRGQQGNSEKGSGFWQSVAQATSLTWNLVVPIVGGALLGRYIDDRAGIEYMWTITLLLGGTFLAFYNLYQILFKGTQ